MLNFTTTSLFQRQNCRFFQLIIVIAILFSTQNSFGQVEGDLTYKFSVNGVTTREAAKPVQYALLQNSFILACDYIDECTCFKLTSNELWSYNAIRTILAENAFELSDKVVVSNGTVLKATNNQLNLEE